MKLSSLELNLNLKTTIEQFLESKTARAAFIGFLCLGAMGTTARACGYGNAIEIPDPSDQPVVADSNYELNYDTD